MSQSLIPKLSDSLDAIRTDRVVSRVRKEVVEAVLREEGRGLKVAARLEGRAHATRVALFNAAMLSKDEESFIVMAPLGEARYKAIVDAYAIYAAGEVGRL